MSVLVRVVKRERSAPSWEADSSVFLARVSDRDTFSGARRFRGSLSTPAVPFEKVWLGPKDKAISSTSWLVIISMGPT